MGLEPVPPARPGKSPGPHYEKRLKAAFVKTAPPGRHTDGGGLYLEVDPSGARRWLLRLVIKGRRRDLGLGSATLVSLADARAKAQQFRRIARTGGDPTSAVSRSPKSITFRGLAGEVHATHIKTTSRNGKHVGQWLTTLETYAFPIIGNAGVDDITTADVVAVLMPIWQSKPETARRVLQRMKVVFDWAILNGHRVGLNPAESSIRLKLPRQKKEVEHFAALDWGEVSGLMVKLEATSGIGAKALRFTILTAMRSGAVRRATWDQFNESLSVWTIPAENMKAGKEFVVPLPTAAIAILRELCRSRSAASPYVFASPSKPKKPLSENTMAKVLNQFYPGSTVHGMRSAFRDWAEEYADAPREVKEYALAHTNKNKVESAYLRTQYFEKRGELMEVWARWITGSGGTYDDLVAEWERDRLLPWPDDQEAGSAA